MDIGGLIFLDGKDLKDPVMTLSPHRKNSGKRTSRLQATTATVSTSKETPPSIFDSLCASVQNNTDLKSIMNMASEDEKIRKKKRSKSKKLRRPKKSQNINSYVRVDIDVDDEEDPKEQPKLVVPYPEVEEAHQLTRDGNSLENTPMVHARPGGKGSLLLNTCRSRTQSCFNRNTCICLLSTFVFTFAIFIAGVTYEDHHIRANHTLVDNYYDWNGGSGGNEDRNSTFGDTSGNGSGPGTYTQAQNDIFNKLKDLSGNLVSITETPHHAAAHWMLWIDNSGITAESPYLWQRYTMVLFFFKMGDLTNFRLDKRTDECTWNRIECDRNGFIKSLTFNHCDMRGKIPAQEIQALINLQQLDLTNNKLTGAIPDELNTLVRLEKILLENNDLIGSMPPQICTRHSSGSLKTLTADCGRSGKVQCSCCNNCASLAPVIDVNQLTPTDLKMFDKFKELSGEEVFKNPSSPQHRAVQWMFKRDTMQMNYDSENLYQRYILTILYFMMDDEEDKCFEIVSGTNECSWAGKSVNGLSWERITCDTELDLKYLKLNDCNMEGPIPIEIQKLSNLNYLDLGTNFLKGAFPLSFEKMDNLDHLYLDHNDLEGVVPSSICAKRKRSDFLASFETDCTTAALKVTCACCTNCDNKESSSGEETLTLGLDERQLGVLAKLRELSGSAVENKNTPQYKAAHWIMKQDSMKLTANSANLYQRYVLVLLREMGDDTCFVLQSGEDECDWSSKNSGGEYIKRIGCYDGGFVELLDLSGCNIRGDIPLEFKVFSEADTIDLSNNGFTGEIVGEIFEKFERLDHIRFELNQLEGKIPQQLCNLERSGVAISADCSSNTSNFAKVSCTCCEKCFPEDEAVSREDGLMEKLVELSGNKVHLLGSAQYRAADWIVNMDAMKLDVSSTTLYQRYVSAILYFMMDASDIFSYKYELSECLWERITCNSNNEVTELQFPYSDLDGHIPSEIKVLKELQIVNFKNNDLYGNIPTKLAELKNLQSLFLEGNDITGSVPTNLCSHRTDETNPLSKLTIDCHDVQCDCCDGCLIDVFPTLPDNEVEEALNQISPETNNPTSPQHLAMQWMINKDKLHHTNAPVGSPRFIQRYVMILLYYSLGGNEDVWKNFVFSDEQDECLVLGANCDDQKMITELDFSNSSMKGRLAKEMTYLSKLRKINISNNDISGEVPAFQSSFDRLNYLNLQNNNLSGKISPALCYVQMMNVGNFKVDCRKVQCTCCNCP